MAVAIECINIIVRFDRLAKVYPGGEEALWDPERTLGYHDGRVLRLGSMSDMAMMHDFQYLKELGLRPRRDFGYHENWLQRDNEFYPASVNLKGDDRALVVDSGNFHDFLAGRLRPLKSRATAVIRNEGTILLVREKRDTFFSLPGGGLKQYEPVLSAAVREVHEELGLRTLKAERKFHADYQGAYRWHHVCELDVFDTQQELSINKNEISGYRWWNRCEPIALAPHVMPILEKLL